MYGHTTGARAGLPCDPVVLRPAGGRHRGRQHERLDPQHRAQEQHAVPPICPSRSVYRLITRLEYLIWRLKGVKCLV